MTEPYRALLEAFGRAWEPGDVDGIVSVFAPDAVFLATPFSDKSVGLDAIRSYWSDVPRNQAEVTFKAGEIYVAGPWFASEFRCTYRRRRTGDWVDTRGALFCETKDGKISAMRMYWHRSPYPRADAGARGSFSDLIRRRPRIQGGDRWRR